MAIASLPSFADANHRFQVDLDGVTYELSFLYNEREDRWFFNLLDLEGNVIRHGLKVVTNFPLLQRIADENRPAGELLAIDASGQDIEAEFDDLGNTVTLTYIERADIEAL